MPTGFQTLGFSASIDERGFISAEVPMFCETINEALTISGGNPFGLPEVSRSINQVESIGYEIKIRYEGNKGPEGSNESEASTYEFESGFKEEPLVNHPNWPTISEKYAGSFDSQTGQITWAQTIPRGNISKKGLSTAAQNQEIANPFVGLQTYAALVQTFRRSYVQRRFPKTQLEAVGTVREKLPKGFPTPKGRNWLIRPPKIAKRGNVWEVTEEWELSKPGKKHLPEIWAASSYSGVINE